jgi:hypothetical protein
MEAIDLSGSLKDIARAVEEIDLQYGPISHMYAISGISNHLKNETAFNLVRIHRLPSSLFRSIKVLTILRRRRLWTR